MEGACGGTPGKQHGEVEPHGSLLFLYSSSLLELKIRGSSRGRGKAEVFLAVNVWESEACDPLKSGNWSNCPQNDKLLIVSAAHRITESQNSRGWKGPLWVI